MRETIKIINDTGNDEHIALIEGNPRVQILLKTSTEDLTAQETITTTLHSCKENMKDISLTSSTGFDGQLSCRHSIATCDDDFQVVFVGTGASLPSKYRNVSSTLLHTRCL